MKKSFIIVLILLLHIISWGNMADHNVVKIVIPAYTDEIECLAADKLLFYLSKMYPDRKFEKVTTSTSSGMQIFVGNANNLNRIGVEVDMNLLPKAESYSVSVIKRDNQEICVISGKDSRGTLNAVYALLEKLGCGFFLSYETVPSFKKFSFYDWQMQDTPIVEDRIVFDWHNFLSGCTGWSLPDWKLWIDQSSKMRFNTIMVHAYGNNPMFQFEFNGIKKPVGYMNTSASGRDWGAQHINDVRLLPGGEIFNTPILGSEAAVVPDEKRAEAAVSLMQKVFQYAHKQGMRVIYAHDIDTKSANPQEIILTLPVSARIKVGEDWLANPETPEGYNYYKTQVGSLFNTYPEIDKLALWVRWSDDITPWRKIRKNDFPVKWVDEYYELLAEQWKLLDDSRSVTTFAISKVVKAYQKALIELGHTRVEVMYGSWGWDDMVPSNYIIPKDVTFIPLDWWINFEYKATEKKLAEIAENRKIIPVVWAHHDDHRYIGKPYTPYSNFADLLEKRGASGYAIIHWTTFPLDLYFSSLARQAWSSTKNEPLDSTLKKFVVKNWGRDNYQLTDYFKKWITEGPMFGRETGNHFMDIGGSFTGKEKLESPQATINKSIERLNLIRQVDKKKIKENLGLLNYFEGSELFYISFFKNQISFAKAWDLLAQKDIFGAKTELSKCNVEETIGMFAKNLQQGPATTSEKAVLFSMGTRWYPDFINMKQRAGIAPVCYKFGETLHDPMAQGAGKYSWFIDKDKSFWSVLGRKELGTGNFKIDIQNRSYLETDSIVSLKLRTISENNLPEGEYKINIDCFGDEKKMPEMELTDSRNKKKYSVDYISQKMADLIRISFTVSIKGDETLQISIKPKENFLLYNLCIENVNP